MQQNKSSMLPIILPSDKPIVEKSNSFSINNIVAFKKGDKLVGHRIIYVFKDKKRYILKGDNVFKSDGIVKRDEILGKIKRVKRGKQTFVIKHVHLTQSSVYLKELSKITKRLSQEKIKYIVLKGLPVNLSLNKRPPDRLYIDQDILIKGDQFQSAKKVLKGLGFRPINPAILNKRVENYTQISFVKKLNPFPVVIDLHLKIPLGFTKTPFLNHFFVNQNKLENYFFNNIKKTVVNKSEFNILKDNALFLFLLIHLFHHNFKGAHRYAFIDLLLRKRKIDLSKVLGDAKKLNVENFITPAFYILKKYYQVPHTFQGRNLFVFSFLDPFSEDRPSLERVKRFLYLFLLSPNPILKKLSVFFSKSFYYYFFISIKSFLSSTFKKVSTSS